jgi:hypothetical protein
MKVMSFFEGGFAMKTIKIMLLVAIVVVGYGTNAGALQYTGSLSNVSPEAGIIGTGSWASNVTLSWLVDDTTNANMWTYHYTWSDTNTSTSPKNLSHIIIELSDNLTGITVSAGTPLIGTYGPNDPGNSNPGIPGSIYGVKVTPTTGVSTFVFDIITDKAPVWGDFYAKDGDVPGGAITNTAYNAGFLSTDPQLAPTNGTIDNKILRPDTTGIIITPEPGTMLLLGFALVGLAGMRRFKK